MTVRRLVLFLPILTVLGLPAWTGEATLLQETSLRSSPDSGERLAFLTPDTPVEQLEERDGWVRVRIEGWVPAGTIRSSVEQASLPTPVERPVNVAPVPAPAPVAAATGVPVEGLIRVRLSRLRKKTGSGASVWVVPAAVDLSTESFTAEEAARFAAIEKELVRLAEEESQAMRISNFSESVDARHRVKREREPVLAERNDLLAARHGRHEHAARSAAVASGVADAKGWFRLASVPPGDYTLYARMTPDGFDVEWAEKLQVRTGSVKLELDETTARGLRTD